MDVSLCHRSAESGGHYSSLSNSLDFLPPPLEPETAKHSTNMKQGKRAGYSAKQILVGQNDAIAQMLIGQKVRRVYRKAESGESSATCGITNPGQ